MFQPFNGYHVREIAPPAASGLLCYRRIRTPEKPVPRAGWTRTRVERFPGDHAPESQPSVSEGCLPSYRALRRSEGPGEPVAGASSSPRPLSRLITNVTPLRRLTLNRYTDPALGVQQSVAVVLRADQSFMFNGKRERTPTNTLRRH